MVTKANQQALRLLAAQINKVNGEHSAVLATDLLPTRRIPTGSLALDLDLGGGWPVNQWHGIVGEWSSGKTSLLLKTIAANQAINEEFYVAWLAAENFDRGFAEMCGVDLDRVLVLNINTMEAAYQAILDAQTSHAVDMVVLDSYPALVAAAEDTKDMDEFTMGVGAKLTNQFMRKQGSAGKRSMVDSSERPCTCFFVNQWREKIGVTHGDPRTTSGGKGKDYTFYTSVDVRRDEFITVGRGISLQRIGQTIKVRIIKNKSAPAQRVATYDFYFADTEGHQAGSIDTFKEIAELGVVCGVIEQRGSWYHFEGMKALGIDNLIDAISEAPEIAELLSKKVLNTGLADEVETVAPLKPVKRAPAKKAPPKKASPKRPAKK